MCLWAQIMITQSSCLAPQPGLPATHYLFLWLLGFFILKLNGIKKNAALTMPIVIHNFAFGANMLWPPQNWRIKGRNKWMTLCMCVLMQFNSVQIAITSVHTLFPWGLLFLFDKGIVSYENELSSFKPARSPSDPNCKL